MNLVARKKIVFVIVEGPSDHDALALILSKIFDSNEVHVEILHRDITTENGITPSNIIENVVDVIKEYAVGSHFVSKHFQRVIHLVDTDGAFIANDKVVEDREASGFVYSTEAIRAPEPQKVIERNLQKRANLLKISRTSKVWNIPYSVFYMSCNLEHVLFNKLNCSDEEKEELSYRFAKQYKDNIPGFLSLISESDFSVCDDYLSSWDFISKENNSLNRYTNLGLCFKNDPDK